MIPVADEVIGSVAVEVLGDAKNLAKNIRKELESSFKDLDFNKLIQDAVGNKPIKLKIEPDFDPSVIGEKVRETRVPKVPVELDPITAAFQASVRSTVASLSRDALKIPVDADAGRLRASLGAQLAAIQAQSKIQVPTEPAGKAEYEAKLRAQLAAVAATVKQSVKIEPKVDSKLSSSLFSGIAGSLKSVIPDIGGIGSAIQGLANGIGQFAQQAAAGGSQLAGSIAAAAGPIGTVISLLVSAGVAMGGLSAAAILAVPAITAVAGAAAAIPAALSGIGAAFGTLSLGFKGITEAFKAKPASGGGGGGGSDPAAQARQVAAAERGVAAARRGVTSASRGLEAAERGLASAERGYADAQQAVVEAQKKATQAQQAVNAARKEAAEDIDDLGRALRGAQLDEEGAALAVTDALRDLNEAKLTGNIPDIEKADLAYRQAQLTLENAKDSAQDLGEEQADANKKGVEGSDKVVAALDAQQQAQEGVKSAQEGVLDAQNAVLSANDAIASAQDSQKSAADGLAAAQDSLAAAQTKAATSGAAAAGVVATKLAPAATAFVNAIKALKPAFEDLRLDVQQRLFEGLDKTVTNLGNAWIPALKVTLGSYADTFNGFFQKLGTNISTPKFISDIQTGAEGARQGLSKIGDAVATKLVPAFGQLSAAAGPFLSQLGGKIAAGITKFSNFIDKVSTPDKGGRSQLGDFFTKASKALDSISTTGGLVVQIVGNLFGIIFGAQASSGKTPLDSFNDVLVKVNTFLTEHGPQISKLITDIAGALVGFGHLASQVDGFLSDLGIGGSEKSSSAGATIGKALVDGLLAGIIEALKLSLELMYLPFKPLVDNVKLIFGIKSPSTVFAEIGRNIVLGLLNGITSLLSSLSGIAGRLKTTVINAVSGAASWLSAAGKNAVIGLANGIVSLYGTVSSRAAGLKNTVANALSNAGNFLYNAGHNIVVGLINGIAGMIGTLGSYLGNIGSFIAAHKGPPSKDAVLLKPAGRLIMQGLIGGIEDKKAALAAQLSDVTSLVAGTNMPALASDLGSVAGSLTSSAGLEIGIAPGSTGDWLMDGLRRNIQVRYRGNAVAALGTA